MSRSSGSDPLSLSVPAAALVFAFVLLPLSSYADVRFQVSGSAKVERSRLEVSLDLKNSGDFPAAQVTVQGELLGGYAETRLDQGLPPGETRGVVLVYPAAIPRPGVHALTLWLEALPGSPKAPQSATAVTQRAFVLLRLGEAAAPAVRLIVPMARVGFEGTLRVGLESADGAAHRARLRVLTARGLQAPDPPAEIAVPASGRAEAPVRILRSGGGWGTRQGVVVVAEVDDGPQARDAAADVLIEIGPDPAWMPRLRRPLLAAAAALLVVAAAFEWWHRRGR